MKKARFNFTPLIIGLILVVLSIGTFFAYHYFTRKGIVMFDQSVPEDLQAKITTRIEAIDFKDEITISAHQSSEKQADDLLYDIKVPVTDFYDSISSVTLDEIKDYDLISILELDDQVKLLAIDGNYFLDTFDSGAIFDYLRVEGSAAEVAKIKAAIQEILPTFPSKDTVLSFIQTGVIALSRGMNVKLDEVGDGKYFAAKIGDFLSSFDLTHTSNEASFSDGAHSRNICAKAGMMDTLTAIGLDIVELTGNHNQDCGDEDALSTIEQYRNSGIKIVGGGETAEKAAEPLQIDQKQTHITMLGYNLSTGGYTLDNTPGANFYTREKALADITAAKERGDFVIVDVQFYECNEYAYEYENGYCDRANSSAGDQIGLFRDLIDMGADIVVGTSAHQTQTYEQYHGRTIYYGLGNLFFDQIWWPGTTRSIMLAHYFWNGKLLQTRIIATIYDEDMQVGLMDEDTSRWFLNRLVQVRPEVAE